MAAVAAVDPHIAEEAVASIKIEYEILPAVLTAPDASRNDAPIPHKLLETETLAGMISGPTNVAKKFVFEQGDVKKGFEEAFLGQGSDFLPQFVAFVQVGGLGDVVHLLCGVFFTVFYIGKFPIVLLPVRRTHLPELVPDNRAGGMEIPEAVFS